MKSISRILLLLLLAVLPITLLSQAPANIIAYMKVTPGHGSDYMEVEQAWKKVHQKAVELGVHNGWQLWRNVHAGANDPYQYITIQWYDNYAHTFGENAPDGWMDEIYTEAEWTALAEKVIASRTYAHEDIIHLVTTAEMDVQKPVKYITVVRMKVKPGMEDKYVKMEKEIFKPYHEALINRGDMAYWGIWTTQPFKEGQARYIAVQGFGDVKTLTSSGEIIPPEELNLGITLEQVVELTQKTRERVSLELWELVDSVFPEE